jgi:hypothetical protein
VEVTWEDFMKGFYREEIAAAIWDVIDHGDQDSQPWIFYPHDSSFRDWTEEEAKSERSNFVKAVVTKLEAGVQ